MAKSSITSFDVTQVEEQFGFRRKKTVTDEVMKMETAGGAIYLRQSAVERAGDDWSRLKGRIRNLANEKAIPYTDHTVGS